MIRVRRICVIAGASILFGVSPLRAEEVTVGGLAFPVDKLENVDDRRVAVTVRGASALVAREQLQNHVVSEWLSSPSASSSLPVNDLAAFFGKSLSERQSERAVLALRALAAHPSADSALIRKCIGELGSGADALRILGEAAGTQGGRDELRAVLIVSMATLDPVWARVRAASFFYTRQPIVADAALEEFVALMRAGATQRAEALIKLLSEMYGANDPLPRRMLAVTNRGQEIRAAASSNTLGKLFPLVDLSATDELTARSLEPLIISVLHEAAEKSVASGAPGQAAAFLSRVKPEWRTPTTIELARKALASAAETGAGLDDPSFLAFFKGLSSGDPEMRETFSNALEAFFEDSLSGGSLARAHLAMDELSSLHPDDDAANDRRRGRLAVGLASNGRSGEAATVLKSVRSTVRIRDKLKLFFYGYYFDLFWIIILLGFPVMTAAFYTSLDRRRSEKLAREAREAIQAAATAEGVRTFYAKQSPIGVTGEGINPILAEYTKSLRTLGLKPGASLQDVKSAYRSLVKDAHPDAHHDAATELGKASEQFIHITSAYDRILELRKKLKIDV